MNKAIWFDMDGTIANLYGVQNWLEMLRAEDPTPYKKATPLINMQSLARALHKLQSKGYKIGIISWLSMDGSVEYGEQVARAKREWLAKHLASVRFDYIDIVEYGTPKQINRNGILFDDEERNRRNWGENAFDEKRILEVLRTL